MGDKSPELRDQEFVDTNIKYGGYIGATLGLAVAAISEAELLFVTMPAGYWIGRNVMQRFMADNHPE